jgi:hypothetical protein
MAGAEAVSREQPDQREGHEEHPAPADEAPGAAYQ